MRRWIACLLAIIVICAQAHEAGYNIPPSIRFTLEREKSSSPIVYYFSPPDAVDKPYPILIICDGSESFGSERSVFFVRDFFTKWAHALNVGYMTIEKLGIDGNEIYRDEFWKSYTRSQRLKDHM